MHRQHLRCYSDDTCLRKNLLAKMPASPVFPLHINQAEPADERLIAHLNQFGSTRGCNCFKKFLGDELQACKCSKHFCASIFIRAESPNTSAERSANVRKPQTLLRKQLQACKCSKHFCGSIFIRAEGPNTSAERFASLQKYQTFLRSVLQNIKSENSHINAGPYSFHCIVISRG